MKRPFLLCGLAAVTIITGCATSGSNSPKPPTLEEQFAIIDANHDGRISREEYGKYLVDDMARYADTDGDGVITRGEFIAFGGKPERFDKLDTNGNGSLTAQEVKSNKEALALITNAAVGADASGDGYVTLAEARAYQQQVHDLFR